MNLFSQISPVFEFSAAFGGDKIATLQFNDGSTQDIVTGNGVTLSAGADIVLPIADLGVRGMIGYKFSTTKASNADITKTAIPIDLLVFKKFLLLHRVAFGLSYHLSPKLNGDGTFLGDIEFDNAPGITAQYSFLLDNLEISAAYTIMKYKANGGELKADHVSIKLAYSL